MKYFNVSNLLELRKEGYSHVVCNANLDKSGNSVAYLYPFKDGNPAMLFADECPENSLEVYEITNKTLELLKGKSLANTTSPASGICI